MEVYHVVAYRTGGKRAFSAAAPTLGNEWPVRVRLAPSSALLKSLLKTQGNPYRAEARSTPKVQFATYCPQAATHFSARLYFSTEH